MIYGIIHDFYTTTEGAEKSVVKFFVKSEAEASASGCTVSAEIPNDALKYDMVKTGSVIGWDYPKVYIEIEGVKNVAFKKVSSPGVENLCYERAKKSNEREERGSKGI